MPSAATGSARRAREIGQRPMPPRVSSAGARLPSSTRSRKLVDRRAHIVADAERERVGADEDDVEGEQQQPRRLEEDVAAALVRMVDEPQPERDERRDLRRPERRRRVEHVGEGVPRPPCGEAVGLLPEVADEAADGPHRVVLVGDAELGLQRHLLHVLQEDVQRAVLLVAAELLRTVCRAARVAARTSSSSIGAVAPSASVATAGGGAAAARRVAAAAVAAVAAAGHQRSDVRPDRAEMGTSRCIACSVQPARETSVVDAVARQEGGLDKVAPLATAGGRRGEVARQLGPLQREQPRLAHLPPLHRVQRLEGSVARRPAAQLRLELGPTDAAAVGDARAPRRRGGGSRRSRARSEAADAASPCRRRRRRRRRRHPTAAWVRGCRPPAWARAWALRRRPP